MVYYCCYEAKTNMKELSEIISENLIFLRKKSGMTQLEFGEKFSYTDKTVSRWENGSIVPSVDILKQIADYYGVTIDYLVNEHHSARELNISLNKSVSTKNKAIFIGLMNSVVLMIAVVIFLAGYSKLGTLDYHVNSYWVAFLWSVPIGCFITAFFTNRWFGNKKWTYIYISIAVWFILLSAFFTFYYENKYWFIFFIGVPIQIAIILLMNLNTR